MTRKTLKTLSFASETVPSLSVTGFSYAGFTRRWLVWPAAAIWPTALVSSALMTALHKIKDGKEGGWSRYKMFLVVFGGAFCYYFLPGLMFPALTYFTWICWIAPDNVMLNQLTGGVTQGLGMGALTFGEFRFSLV